MEKSDHAICNGLYQLLYKKIVRYSPATNQRNCSAYSCSIQGRNEYNNRKNKNLLCVFVHRFSVKMFIFILIPNFYFHKETSNNVWNSNFYSGFEVFVFRNYETVYYFFILAVINYTASLYDSVDLSNEANKLDSNSADLISKGKTTKRTTPRTTTMKDFHQRL